MQMVYQLMRLNRALGGWRLKAAGVVAADLLRMRHLSVRIDPILACNVRCVSYDVIG